MNQERIRPARKEECATIAALYSLSSDGVANYIWTELAEPAEDILTVGRRRDEGEDSAFSNRNCTVVEIEGSVIGMLVTFPMRIDPAEEESDPVFAPYRKLEEDDSYYICGMALFPEHHGRGIGTRLLALAEEHARDKEFRKVSLIVFEQNSAAKRLYEKTGDREVVRKAVYPHPLIHCTGDAILMVKEVA